MLMSTQLTILILYLILLIGIAWYAKKLSAGGGVQFLFAGRRMSVPLIAVSIAGIAIGGVSTIGVAENAFTKGIAAGWYDVAWALGAAAMGLFGASRYRKMECTTVPELFERYYDRKSRIIAVAGMAIIHIVITALQYVAGGAILSSLLPQVFSFEKAMVFSALVFIAMTLLGGLWSASLSNLVSVTIIYVGIIVGTLMIVAKQGGLHTMAAKLPPGGEWFSPFGGLGGPLVLSWILVFITQTFTAQAPVQVACGARDGKTARIGFLWGALLIFPMGFLSALMGLAARVAYPDIRATLALPKIVMDIHPIASGLTLAALWAADVSTACTLLLGTGTLFAQDIYKRFIHPSITERSYLLVNRLIILGVGMMTLWLAFNVAEILQTIMIGLCLTTALTLIFLFTVFAPGMCRKSSAFYTTLAGILVVAAWLLFDQLKIFVHPIYLEWPVCLAVFLLVGRIDRRRLA
jgi:SSS family solute:Na+ symporter